MKNNMRFLTLVSRCAAGVCAVLLLFPFALFAQEPANTELTTFAATTATASHPVQSTSTATTTASSALETLSSSLQFSKADLTRPEETEEKEEIILLIEQRPITDPGLLSMLGYWVQQAILVGIPANTIVLILLVPVLATMVTFVRTIVGLPSLEMLVPITLAFVFVAVGVAVGLIVLTAIIAASFASRALLRKAPLMYFPKRSLSLLLLAFFVFAALTAAIGLDIERVRELSIFPLLILTLLGDSVVSVQLHKSIQETIVITTVTIVLGLIGFMLATMVLVRDLFILYPEVVLLTIPANILMGRYFGLRLSELFRFRNFYNYGSE